MGHGEQLKRKPLKRCEEPKGQRSTLMAHPRMHTSGLFTPARLLSCGRPEWCRSPKEAKSSLRLTFRLTCRSERINFSQRTVAPLRICLLCPNARCDPSVVGAGLRSCMHRALSRAGATGILLIWPLWRTGQKELELRYWHIIHSAPRSPWPISRHRPTTRLLAGSGRCCTCELSPSSGPT